MFKGNDKGGAAENGPISLRRLNKPAPSIIGADLVIVGTLTSTGDIQIDGRVDGDIRASSLTVGEKANYEGNVTAEEVSVHGRLEGTIRARKVSLGRSSHVEGTILHESLSVDVGAFFEGDCCHSADPLSEVAAAAEARRHLPDAKSDVAVTAAPATNAMQKSNTRNANGNLIGVIKAVR